MPTAVLTNFAANGLIVSNPAILGGRPVFSGTRVPADALFDYLNDGLSRFPFS
jgi:uncharacterized protein (DUF433 family)